MFLQDCQHILVDPTFNLFGVREFAGIDETIQTALVDDCRFSQSAGGGDFPLPFYFLNQRDFSARSRYPRTLASPPRFYRLAAVRR